MAQQDNIVGKEKKVVLFMTNKKIEIVHMPLLVEEIKQIGREKIINQKDLIIKNLD